ncbi:ribosome-associated protein [Weissella oryzae SG25]|uniref:Ribosome-associated protein n=1 Tax=Weissella oryzae (strain DSM 25784 / JCM 18191 / LMG 30913 / SG25) TaxID=1329250 RepID=A0A069D128_WEIOS|nr:hypothetical protein [Weissella oryzae]GAK31066.1 ribosome-associated protein [Weissella oryzae SG25]
MAENRRSTLELLSYFFSRQRADDRYILAKQTYEKLKIDSLENEFNRVKIQYGWHQDIYKILSKVLVWIGAAATFGLVAKVGMFFLHTNKKMAGYSPDQIQFAMLVTSLFLLTLVIILIIGLISYRKYINILKNRVDMIKKILKDRGDIFD